jgi:hypothetical protein
MKCLTRHLGLWSLVERAAQGFAQQLPSLSRNSLVWTHLWRGRVKRRREGVVCRMHQVGERASKLYSNVLRKTPFRD